MDCMVTDLSDEGAKLQLRVQDVTFPTHFKLRIGAEATPRDCQLRWLRSIHAGIEFRRTGALINSDALRARLISMKSRQVQQ